MNISVSFTLDLETGYQFIELFWK